MFSFSLIISSIISGVIGVIATAIYNLFKAPYPVGKMDLWFRKHVRKSKINGTNFIFERTIEIRGQTLNDIFTIMKCETSGQTTDIFDKIQLSGVKLSNGIRINDEVKADLIIKKTHSKFELLFSLNRLLSEEPDEEDEEKVTIVMRTVTSEWNYNALKGLIDDSKEIMYQVTNIIQKQYKDVEIISNIVFFDTRKPPLILLFIREVNEHSNDVLNLKMNEYMRARFYDNKCEFVDVRSDSDTDLILNAIIRYV